MAKLAAKLSAAELLKTSYYYFYAGFMFLPILWLINYLYVSPELKSQRTDLAETTRNKIAWYMRMSLFGSIVWFIGMTTWFAVFCSSWQNIPNSESLLVIVPRGIN